MFRFNYTFRNHHHHRNRSAKHIGVHVSPHHQCILKQKKCGMCVRRSETKFSSKKFHVYVVRAFNGMKLRKIFLERYTNKNRCEMNALVFYPWSNLIFLFSKITPAPVSVSKSFPVRYKKSFDKNSHNNCFTIKWKLRVAMLLDSILM